MFERFEFSAETITQAADHGLPVSLYGNLRQIFPESLLLECLDYKTPETARSYLCAEPLLKFRVKGGEVQIEIEGRRIETILRSNKRTAVSVLTDLQRAVDIGTMNGDLAGLACLFGYVGYSAIPFFEDLEFSNAPPADEQIPDMQFALYRYVIRFDHFNDQITALKLLRRGEKDDTKPLRELLDAITYRRAPEYQFARVGEEQANLTDEQFAETVRICQKHIRHGDVYQIVPSRKFVQGYRGDEFQVYRALRRINPSPFLFFFDYGNFALFGSSPEAQLLIRDGIATLHPIAGTYPRGANISEDREFAENLQNDPKESAEHVMLVDLARNDLNRNCEGVGVESFKQIEFYSHVIHLVSKVSGKLEAGASAAKILADTFPAGTLSGAPKYKAMQILNEIEPTGRSFYGGSVGFLDLNGDCTQAIMIRSFLARRRKLIFQAGAGIVSDSDPEKETAEVQNKLGALRRAIDMAERSGEQ
jgi:anthranilate synthase component 1